MTASTTETERKHKKLLVIIGISFAGGVVGYFLGHWLGSNHSELFDNIGASEIVAAAIALIYVLMAVMVLIGLVSPRFGAQYLNVEDAEEIEEQRRALTTSGWSMLFSGASLGILVATLATGAIGPAFALVLALAGLLLATWLGLHTMKVADELMREVMREAASLSYYIMLVILGGWATLAVLDFASAPRPLDILSAFWGIAMIASFWVCGKRGMLSLR